MAVSGCTDLEKTKAELAPCGRAAEISILFAIPFVLLGIISDAANITIGLEPMSWFLMTIATALFGIFARIGWAVAWYLNTKKDT